MTGNQSLAHFERPVIDRGHIGNGSAAPVLSLDLARLMMAAQQVQHVGTQLPTWHGIQCGVDGFVRYLHRIGHTSQYARNLYRAETLLKALQHLAPEPIARFEHAPASWFCCQNPRSAISRRRPVTSRNGPHPRLAHPAITVHLAGDGRPSSVQYDGDCPRAYPRRQLRLNRGSIAQIQMLKTLSHMQLSPKGKCCTCSLNPPCPISRSFFARCGIPPMLTAKCVGRIESQRERAVVSHISRKTSEIWGTRHWLGNQRQTLRDLAAHLNQRHDNSWLR